MAHSVADTLTSDKKSMTIKAQKDEKQKQTDTSFECTMLRIRTLLGMRKQYYKYHAPDTQMYRQLGLLVYVLSDYSSTTSLTTAQYSLKLRSGQRTP